MPYRRKEGSCFDGAFSRKRVRDCYNGIRYDKKGGERMSKEKILKTYARFDVTAVHGKGFMTKAAKSILTLYPG